jgi:hypothetical protein
MLNSRLSSLVIARIPPQHVHTTPASYLPITATSPNSLSCHHRASSRALISPRRRQYTNSLVVSAEAVDSGLDENESELAVLVLAVALEVLTHSNGFLDQHVEIFWDFGCETYNMSLCQSESLTETNSEAVLGL